MLINLSECDKELITSLHPIVESIASLLGNHTEVVLHSLDVENPSVVQIINGHVTDRTVGAPITDLALSQLQKTSIGTAPYFTRAECGKRLRSVTSVITNKARRPIAMLCINMDMEAPVLDVIATLAPAILQMPKESPETFFKSAEDMIHNSMDKILDSLKTKEVSKRSRTSAVIRDLYNEGLFSVKDAVAIVADRLGVSTDTVYRNLRHLKNAK
ncbi:helix-turn-helix transcriptional regulator [Vibrio jasicida]|uniref:helix-turn-helix transcriptional regulator n=1 Tax=Vibrio jasicida TaxID=766224 RepID=UPI000CE4BD59|nr:PAS domain-containing protein [Vibrio jasicida]